MTRARRIRRRLLVGAAVVSAAVWLLSHYRPGWYRPARVVDADLQRIRGELTIFLDEFGDSLAAGRPFEVELNADRVNEWLAAWPKLYPADNPLASRDIHEPAIGFSSRGVDVGARFRSNVLEAIGHARLDVRLSHDGSELLIAVARVRVGSLPAPRSLVLRLLRRSLESPPGDEGRLQGVVGSDGRFHVVNRFIWPNGRRAFRIHSLALDRPGTMRLTIEPL